MTDSAGEQRNNQNAGMMPAWDFCSLEQRYRGMVFSVALRSVGCPETAREVTQDVFLLLARKGAHLAAEQVCGWLHWAAVLKSRERLRGEHRYHRRLVEYARRREHEASVTAADHLLDRLDSALDSLSDADRRVIFLRYFEGLNAAEIATCLDISAEAAQKKCERARTRLAAKLAAGSLLSASAIHAQTAEVLAKAAGGLRPLNPAGSRVWAAAGPFRLILGSVAVLVLVSLTVWKLAGSSDKISSAPEGLPSPARVHQPGIKAETATHDMSADRRAGEPAAHVRAATTAVLNAPDLLRVAQLLERADEGDSSAATEAETMLRAAGVDVIRQAADAVPALETSPNQLRVLALGMVRHLAQRDPRSAVLAGESFWRAQHGASAPALAALVQEALWAWSRQDSGAAREWYDGIAAEGMFEDRGEDAPGFSEEDFASALALHASTSTLEARVMLAQRLITDPLPGDPAWTAMADVWAHKLLPREAWALADALWQDAAVPSHMAFALRLALVTLPVSAPEEAALHWAATPHGSSSPDAALAFQVASAWQHRQAADAVPAWLLRWLSPSPAIEPEPKPNSAP